jgi:flagellar motor switch protein FliG
MPGPIDEYRKAQKASKPRRTKSEASPQRDSADVPRSAASPRRTESAASPRRDPSIRGFIKETARDAGYRKAAQFLMLLSKAEAARVLKHMSPEEVEGIAREIARTERIDEKEASKVLEEFGYIRETKDLIAKGGIEKAEEMLVASVGAEKAAKILEKVRKDMAPPPFSFMKDIDAHQAIALVREESAPVASLILAHLEPKLAARILIALPPEMQSVVVGRIAKMQTVNPEVIRAAEETLRGKVHKQGEGARTEEINGKSALTDILRYMDPGAEKAILEELDPNIANLIRHKLFTMDVVFQIPDKDLQKVMRDYADKELALVIDGAEETVRARLFASVSERRRELIRLDQDALTAVRKSDLARAEQDFLEYIQLLEQKGEITILREREQFV